jgi:type IV pilus assembly protein PilA
MLKKTCGDTVAPVLRAVRGVAAGGLLRRPTFPGVSMSKIDRVRQNGFSLIELLIVVSIILVISAIAIPSYLRSRLQANEASAVASVRLINTSAISYSSTYTTVGYPPSLADLGGANPCVASSTAACFLDESVAQGTKSGYTFIWTGDGATPSVAYTLTATPAVLGSSGQRQFCSDQTDVIRFEQSGSGCTSTSSPIQ